MNSYMVTDTLSLIIVYCYEQLSHMLGKCLNVQIINMLIEKPRHVVKNKQLSSCYPPNFQPHKIMKRVKNTVEWFNIADKVMSEIILLKVADENVLVKLINTNLEKAVYCDMYDSHFGNGYDYYTTTVTPPEQGIRRN